MVPLVITVAIFVAIFLKIDKSEFLHNIENANLIWLLAALLVFIPATAVSAERWRLLVRKECDVTLWASIRLTLAASSFNVVIPSKLGDVSKAYFLRNKGSMNLKKGAAAVALEKALDVNALCILSIFGIIVVGEFNEKTTTVFVICTGIVLASAMAYLIDFSKLRFVEKVLSKKIDLINDAYSYLSKTKRSSEMPRICVYSMVLWTTHLFQVYLFFLTLNMFLSPFLVFGLVPIGIFVGLIPITIAGMGTRDSAFLFLFADHYPASMIVGVGVLFALRYVVPALAGLLFLGHHMRQE